MSTTRKQDDDFLLFLFPTFDLQNVLDWIGREFQPEDVFDEKVLIEWALSHEFTDKEEGE